MGKKTRKTRWRTLSIGEGPSDSESQAGDGAKSQNARGRWQSRGSVGAPGAQQRYNSSHSTPTRYNRQYYSTHNDAGHKWGPAGRGSYPSNSTRSSSTASETKITFNEDEYTKITTPRQDVLFKKGYLSKPKPHLQRPLTSAGNSTGDGTPDHHSADGADYPEENELEAPFLYPTATPPMTGDNGVYYLNAYDPIPTQPLLLYDQFGNATLCYPPPPAPHLAPYAGPRVKRYSVDSVTESASPNNESNETFPETDEVFEGVKAFPGEEQSDNGDEERALRKKRRRRKTEADKEDENEDEEEEEEETLNVSLKCKYRVDAEEFVPRSSFVAPPPAVGFLPIMPHELFPGAFVLMGPPPPPTHFYQAPASQSIEPYIEEDNQPPVEVDAVEEPTEIAVDETIASPQPPPPPPIDIAKIVSKLEQAALEQKLLETTQDKEKIVEKKQPEEAKVKPSPKLGDTNKTETKPAAARYADRLKTQQLQTPKPPLHATASHTTKHSSPRTPPAPAPCPRLERTASVSKTACTTPSANTTSNNNSCSSLAPPDQWISVSGKKKRKSKLQTPLVQEVEAPAMDTECHIEAHKPEECSVTEPEVVEDQAPPTTDRPIVVKTKKEKERSRGGVAGSKKAPRKRIIVTDGAIQVPERPLPVVVKAAATEAPPLDEKKPTRKKKNRSKAQTVIANDAVESADVPKGPTNDNSEDVSLELERMIQRGLYSTLEQRLVAHNPDDRFLATLAAPRVRSPGAGTPPAITVPLVTSPSPPSIALPEVSSTGAASGAITRAVREWMNRTRETTPEVEIFRRPQELRPEVLLAIEPTHNNDDTIHLDQLVELEVDVDDEFSDDDVDRTAKDATSLIGDVPRSRSQSMDLLQCWEYDVEPQHPVGDEPLAVVEQGEDVLEQYDSVYGHSGDLERIQSEVQALRPRGRPRARADPAYLPYRAICCTVM